MYFIGKCFSSNCLYISNFHQLEVVGRDSDTQLQMGKKNFLCLSVWRGNPFNPEFTIVIFIHYKSRIAAAMTWCGLKIKENYHVLVNQFNLLMEMFVLKPLVVGKLSLFSGM